MGSGYFKSLSRGLTSLVFTDRCLGCDSQEQLICRECEVIWNQAARPLLGESFKVFSSVPYDHRTARVLLSAKEDGLRVARELISSAISRSILRLVTESEIDCERILLTPIPSSRAAKVRRGGDFLAQVTKEVLSRLEPSRQVQPGSIAIKHLLGFTRRTRDQSRLSERQRNINLQGAFRVRRDALSEMGDSAGIIVVDDVITTGSTLREAIRALKERNLTVLGAATACATRLNSLIR